MSEKNKAEFSLPENVAAIQREPKKIVTRSPGETENLGKAVSAIKELQFIAMKGDLGTGKTTFIRGLARGMQIKKRIKSPTFVLRQDYEGPKSLKHLDFYRLENPRELEALGWPFEGRHNIWAVEWADRFPEMLPTHCLWISFELLDDTSRKISIGTKNG